MVKVLELVAIELSVLIDEANKIVDLNVETIREGLSCQNAVPKTLRFSPENGGIST
jgi:hypothetical protein